MHVSSQNTNRLCALVLLATVLGAVSLAVTSGMAKSRRIRRGDARVQAQLEELRGVQDTLSRLSAVLAENKEAFAKLQAQFSETGNIGNFMKELDSIEARRKVVLSDLRPLPAVREDLCTRIPVQCSWQGPFPKLYTVLYDLENVDRVMRIERISMARASVYEPCKMDIDCSIFARQ